MMPDVAALRRLGRSAERLARTRYPPFLFGGGVPEGEIPVFTYHDVSSSELEEDLEFLERNGYRTLSLAEHADRSSGRNGAAERCVLLTFDDARQSFWRSAMPVLRRREARAVLFVPSYWVGERNVTREASTPPGFMSWAEIGECERSGLVDVESHGHRHTLVHVAPRLAGFATPATLARHDLFDWPMRRERDRDVCGRPPLGTPVYESAPLLSAGERYLEPAAAVAACRALVQAGGGGSFFARRSALAELRAAHDATARRVPAERSRPGDLRALVEAELILAVETFERELGRRPRHFAYPWALGSDASLSLLADLGFSSAFGVALDFRRAGRSAGLPLVVRARYKSDWLRFLPGTGRRHLGQVVPRKLASFLRTQHLAH